MKPKYEMTEEQSRESIARYLRLLRLWRDAAGNQAERLVRRAEAEFFVMDGPTATAAIAAARAEGLPQL